MPRLEPAYRTRAPDDARYRAALAVYASIRSRRRRAADLVAVQMAVPSARDRRLWWIIDYAAVPVLWIGAVLMVWPGGQWWIVPASLAHLAALYALLRLGR